MVHNKIYKMFKYSYSENIHQNNIPFRRMTKKSVFSKKWILGSSWDILSITGSSDSTSNFEN